MKTEKAETAVKERISFFDIIKIAGIIILTDGYAPFPDEKEAVGIPVLCLLNNKDVDPPWGKVARIKV